LYQSGEFAVRVRGLVTRSDSINFKSKPKGDMVRFRLSEYNGNVRGNGVLLREDIETGLGGIEEGSSGGGGVGGGA